MKNAVTARSQLLLLPRFRLPPRHLLLHLPRPFETLLATPSGLSALGDGRSVLHRNGVEIVLLEVGESVVDKAGKWEEVSTWGEREREEDEPVTSFICANGLDQVEHCEQRQLVSICGEGRERGSGEV
jgi:hypothetical protein